MAPLWAQLEIYIGVNLQLDLNTWVIPERLSAGVEGVIGSTNGMVPLSDMVYVHTSTQITMGQYVCASNFLNASL